MEFSKAGRINAIDGVTSVDSIYAVGDIVEGNPALAPVAVKDGELLARRIFGKSDKKVNHFIRLVIDNRRLIDLTTVPMCVYTPFEFGTVGLSEEAAKVGIILNVSKYALRNVMGKSRCISLNLLL